MNKEGLLALREIFRARMREKDFCIGEEQVEILFHELLEEPIPKYPEAPRDARMDANVAAIVAIEIEKMSEKVKILFERDDTFWRKFNAKS